MNQPPKSINYGMKALWAARCCLVLCLLPAYAEVGLVVGGVALAAYSAAHCIGLVRRPGTNNGKGSPFTKQRAAQCPFITRHSPPIKKGTEQ